MRRNRLVWNAALGGFSMVEVFIALIVVGVLIVLIVNSLQAVAAKSRDALRRSDIDNIAQKLEACYGNKDTCDGTYPSLLQLTDTSPTGFVATNLAGFSNDWLIDSSGGVIQANSASAATQYQYATMPQNCTGTGGEQPCTGFTLSTYQETNPTHAYVKESLNK